MLQCEIIGNIGQDAEIKEFGGKKYVSFNVAHTDFGKDQSGNRTEETIWVSVLWYGDGGGLFQYLKRGSKVFVRGRQKVKLYSDKNGNPQYGINVSANEDQLCGIKGETSGSQSAAQQQPPISSSQQDDLAFRLNTDL